jgi:virulence factor Mce-like protein
MRRAAIPIASLAAAIGAVLLVTGVGTTPTYRVAAIFDTAKGMVAGQQVKIAGAVVGSVQAVELAPGPKARIVMSVDRRFAPFHEDASCTILPEGLISENFVQCDPGAPDSPPLAVSRAGIATVPLQHTTVPTSLQDLLNVFSLPTDDRLRVIINELGIATAGRGEDLNALLRRADPALAQSQQVLSMIDSQRQQLAVAIGQTDRVLGALAQRDDEVRAFVDRAAAVATTTAEHKNSLGASIHRLPALLDALRPGLRSLDRAMSSSTPLLGYLRAAAPGLTKLTALVPSFATAGTPALRSLGDAADAGRLAVRVAGPVVSDLKRASAQAGPFAQQLDQLLLSTRDAGGLEGILRFFYSVAVGDAAYDQTSHMQTLLVTVYPQCLHASGAPGCSSAYSAPGNGTIPPNDPACGPQPGEPWDPPTNCSSMAAAKDQPARRRRVRRPAVALPSSTSGAHVTAPVPAGRSPATPAPPPIQAPSAPSPLMPLLRFLLGR